MRFLSWNVNGIRAVCKNGLLEVLQKTKPDVASFQEIKAIRDQAPEDFVQCFKEVTQEWHPAVRPGYSGVLDIYLKNQPKKIQRGCGLEKFDQEGRVLCSDFGDFYYLNMYFPNGGSGEPRHLYKMDFLSKILPYFQKLDKEKPLILTGDFNIAHKEVDIHDPVRLDGTSGFKPEERKWMDDLVSAGFVDVFRHQNPKAKEKYSWWSYRQGARKRNKGWRIDYFFVSDRLKDRIKKMEMLHETMGSDHCPLVIEIK